MVALLSSCTSVREGPDPEGVADIPPQTVQPLGLDDEEEDDEGTEHHEAGVGQPVQTAKNYSPIASQQRTSTASRAGPCHGALTPLPDVMSPSAENSTIASPHVRPHQRPQGLRPRACPSAGRSRVDLRPARRACDWTPPVRRAA